jgi:hypothetical protein
MRYLKNWNNFEVISEAFKSEYLSSYFASLRKVPSGASPETIKSSLALSSFKSEDFIHKIKQIGYNLNFPISEIPDEFLFYLPYKEARALNYNVGDRVCEASSESLFGDSGVVGEICNAGKIKRKWGRSIREVSCTSCGGSGIMKNKDKSVKWIKFWFDLSGKFIRATGVDGELRKASKPSGTTYKNFTGERFFKRGQSKTLRQCKHGDIVIVNIYEKELVCQVWYDEDADKYYFVQNYTSSERPGFINNTNGLKKSYFTPEEYLRIKKDHKEFTEQFGRFFDRAFPHMDYFISEAIELEQESKLDWNAALTISADKGVEGVYCDEDRNIDADLKKANYAIVLDYKGLSESGFEKRSDITVKRGEEKEGLIRPEDYEDIKIKNLEKRMSKITDRYIVGDNLENLKSVYGTILNGKYMFFQNLLNRRKTNWGMTLSTPGQSFHDRLSAYMRAKSAGKNIESSLDDLNTWIKNKYSSLAEFHNLAIIINDLKNDWKNYEYLVGAIEKLEEMSKWTWNKFSTIKIEDQNDVWNFNDKLDDIYKSMTGKGSIFATKDNDGEIEWFMSAILAYVNEENIPQQRFEAMNKEDLLGKMDKFIENSKKILE